MGINFLVVKDEGKVIPTLSWKNSKLIQLFT